MKFCKKCGHVIRESNESMTFFPQWCGKWVGFLIVPTDVNDQPKGYVETPETAKMNEEYRKAIENLNSKQYDDFINLGEQIITDFGYEVAYPDDMNEGCDETERCDGGAQTACCVIQENYTAGDVAEFIGNRQSNRKCKVVVKESGKIKGLKDIYFKNGQCVIDIV